MLLRVTCCCPLIQLSEVSHAFSATISVCPCHCLGIVFICASLLGPTSQPSIPLYLSVVVITFCLSTTGPTSTSQVQFAYPGISLRQCTLCFSCFRLLLFRLSTRLPTSLCAGYFSCTVQLMVPRQPSMSNVVDSDILSGSVRLPSP